MTVVDIGALLPATTVLECDGHRHRLRWEAGVLIAPDHRGPEGDPVNAAAAATKWPCTEVLNAWEALKRDPRLLSVLTRGPRDQVVPATAQGDGAPSGLAHFLPGPNAGAVAAQGGGSGAPDPTVVPRPGSSPTQVRAAGGVDEHPAPGAHLGGRGASTAVPGLGLGPIAGAVPLDDRASGLGLLARLGGDIPLRLAATVTAQLLNDLACNEPDAERALPALEVSLIARASKALSNWWDDTESNIYVVAEDGNRSSVTTPRVQVAVAEEGTKPFVEQGDDGPGLRRRGSLRAALPLRWVADIWGQGLAVVGNRFSLALVEASPGRAVLETVGADFRPPRLLTVELS